MNEIIIAVLSLLGTIIGSLSGVLAANRLTNYRIQELEKQLPGLRCGSCGAPSCHALAEDIVRGQASKSYCIHILRDHIHTLSNTCAGLVAEAAAQGGEYSQERLQELAGQLDQLDTEITMMDVGHRPAVPPEGTDEEGGTVG